jgi:prolyl-tRNA editing enzyme YbaK/EbsC (Cys-tRNA(Pro) deacylase)
MSETSPDSALERRVLQALDATGVPYRVIEIDPAFAETVNFCERYGFPLETSGNTIIVATKKDPKTFGACVVRASERLDVNHRVKKLLAAGKLSFASADDTRALTGMEIGGVTPFDLPAGIPLYVDEGLMAHEAIILGGGSRSKKIEVTPEVLRGLPGVLVLPDLVLPPRDGPGQPG